jgi:predicted ATP-dependent serine protease
LVESASADVVDALLGRARLGRAGALVVHGEAGIGKTALLQYAVEQAEGMTVVRALGVESSGHVRNLASGKERTAPPRHLRGLRLGLGFVNRLQLSHWLDA